MSLIATVLHCLAGTGSRRAVDRIPELQAQLHAADTLITSQAQEIEALKLARRALATKLTAVEEQLATVATAHELLLDEYDELASRYTAVDTDLQNLRAITVPAPADHGPAIPIRPYDPDATEEHPVLTLWDAHGLRAA